MLPRLFSFTAQSYPLVVTSGFHKSRPRRRETPTAQTHFLHDGIVDAARQREDGPYVSFHKEPKADWLGCPLGQRQSQTKTYDAASQLLSNTHKLGTTTVSGHGYTYDATSRRTAETFSDGATPSRGYGYDTADQVTSATYGGGLSDAYDYDASGNRNTATLASQGGASLSYSANAANQYTAITSWPTPTYDANGNLLTQNGNTYTWDSHNRLLSISPTSPSVGDKSFTYQYDGQHRRVLRTLREYTTSGWTPTAQTHFLYDGWNVIEEESGTGGSSTFTLTRILTWGEDLSGRLQGAGGVGGLLMAEEITSTTTTAYYYHYDGNGNVTEITDDTGSSAASYRYDAYGNTLTATGSYASTNHYRFSTKPLDHEVTNAPLYYYGYRYYDPVTGRWPSRDPIGERGGVNVYGMVGNCPVRIYDYLGMWYTDVHHLINQQILKESGLSRILKCNCCEANLLNNLNNGSDYADGAGKYLWRFVVAQASRNSFQHGMTNPRAGKEESVRLFYDFIMSEILDAARIRNEGSSVSAKNKCKYVEKAFFEIGRAVHAVADMGSPMHGFEEWNGLFHGILDVGPFDLYKDGKKHTEGENMDFYINENQEERIMDLLKSFKLDAVIKLLGNCPE